MKKMTITSGIEIVKPNTDPIVKSYVYIISDVEDCIIDFQFADTMTKNTKCF